MKIPEYLPDLKAYKYLIPKKYHPLAQMYIKWWYLLSLRGVGIKHKADNSISFWYKAMRRDWSDKFLLGKLQQEFIKENLSLSLLMEPIDGFQWLSRKLYPLGFSSSSPIFLQIASPISRFIAVTNNQHPPFYQPFTNLLGLYLCLYLKAIPSLEKTLAKANIKLDEDIKADKQHLQYEETQKILIVTKGLKFKLIISFYLGLYKVLMKKKNKRKLVFLDFFNGFLYGLWYVLSIRGKSISVNRI